MAKIWYKKDPYLLDKDVLFDLTDRFGLEAYGLMILLFDEMVKSEERLLTEISIRRIKKQYCVKQDLMDEVLACELFYHVNGAYGCDIIDEAVKAHDRAVEKSKAALEKRWLNHKSKIDKELYLSNTQVIPKYYSSNTDKIRLDKTRLEKKKKDETIRDAVAYDANNMGENAATASPVETPEKNANNFHHGDHDDLPF